MSLSFQATNDLLISAKLTQRNMHPYYAHYGVDWQIETITAQIAHLENLDIVCDGSIIGIIRLAFDDQGCYIRDFQIEEKYQNRGMGALALAHCEIYAKQLGYQQLRLRVFQISPAIHLYERCGFTRDKAEDNFYYLSKQIG
ncbi:hypothetical protein VST7929_01170 [Vibrio stylophorae]|uniref:N-acetyltransferase domain-containing protein n=1 Tax=Vibrio stylophorae TaxID=659351 RepID=A0ABN8DTK2_9VIBR|nr:GNAT family N-acetyltransferase [Vibrio stylophorae]CAH0533306.1 hypothetical protein VST7929_01170 [Vibrio stylophorae]